MPKAPGNPSPPSTLRGLLKRHTAAAHEALQASPPVGRLLAADLTWPEYRDLLGRYYGFLEPLGQRWHDHPARSPWAAFVKPALRLEELRRDLQMAGADLNALPLADVAWMQTEPPFTVGVIYVLLGSSLGGKLIARSLTQSLGLTADRGCAYFAASDEVGSWRRFLEELELYPWSEADLEWLQTAALHTFAQLHRWFGQHDE